MTAIIRETYYAPLFALLQGAANFKTAERRVRHLETMDDGELPALFMAVGHQPVERDTKAWPKRKLLATVFLYCANPDAHISADIALNALLDAVEAALEPAPGQEMQTLGNLVSHCWIKGEVEVFAGWDGVRAAAIVPIEIMVP